jgi:hypothetical protein
LHRALAVVIRSIASVWWRADRDADSAESPRDVDACARAASWSAMRALRLAGGGGGAFEESAVGNLLMLLAAPLQIQSAIAQVQVHNARACDVFDIKRNHFSTELGIRMECICKDKCIFIQAIIVDQYVACALWLVATFTNDSVSNVRFVARAVVRRRAVAWCAK